MKSYMASPATIERKWYVVDATGYTLGRLASEVAKILRGKNKPIFTPFIDTGDYVIITNADKIKVTGKKLEQKVYYRHSDYVGGMKETTLKEMLNKKPERVIELAVKGMLPKGRAEKSTESSGNPSEMDRRRRRISAAGSRTVRDTGEKEVGGERLKRKIQQYCLILRDKEK